MLSVIRQHRASCVVVSCVIVRSPCRRRVHGRAVCHCVVRGRVIVIGWCVVRHASLCHRRCRDAMAMAICIALLLLCRHVVHACHPSWVVVVVVMSCGVGRHGSLMCQCGRREFERDIPPGYHHLRRRCRIDDTSGGGIVVIAGGGRCAPK